MTKQRKAHYSKTITVQKALDYLIYLPKDYDSEREQGYPLVLFLHGAGERGDDIEKVKVHGPPKLVENGKEFPFILVSPQCPSDQVWDPEALSGLLDEIIDSHHVDLDRVYLTGLSMGGYGTWSLGLKEVEAIRGNRTNLRRRRASDNPVGRTFEEVKASASTGLGVSRRQRPRGSHGRI